MQRIHKSDVDGRESVLTPEKFREEVRAHGFADGGGVQVVENVTILSFDDDEGLTFVINGINYTPLP